MRDGKDHNKEKDAYSFLKNRLHASLVLALYLCNEKYIKKKE